MVDYNNEATISTPPGDILKVAILERRAYFINALEKYKQIDERGATAQDHVVKAALFALWLELSAALKNDLEDKTTKDGKPVYDELKDKIDSGEYLEAFLSINDWLYKKNLTKFDTRRDVDTEDIEAVNIEHGF